MSNDHGNSSLTKEYVIENLENINLVNLIYNSNITFAIGIKEDNIYFFNKNEVKYKEQCSMMDSLDELNETLLNDKECLNYFKNSLLESL